MTQLTINDIEDAILTASTVFKRTRNYQLLKHALEVIKNLEERSIWLSKHVENVNNYCFSWKLWADTPPKLNGRIAALYNDGSGGIVCSYKDGNIFDLNNDLMDPEYFDESILYWAYLPTHFKLWHENNFNVKQTGE